MVRFLVGQGDVHHQIGLVVVDEGDELIDVVASTCAVVIFVLVMGASFWAKAFAFGFGAACNAKFGEMSLTWQHFLNCDAGNTARSR